MYYLVYVPLYVLSLLPLRILYLFSDFGYFIVYHVVGYRKKIVLANLSIAFPEKSEKEKLSIAKKFYRNFTDTFIETIKLLSANNDFIKKHCVGDETAFLNLYKEGKKCQIHLGHNFNWEIANLAFALYTPFDVLTVYMPISNKPIDRLFKKIRSKTGSILIPANQMSKVFLQHRHKQYALALVADQNPGNWSQAYWLIFFGKPTPFAKGPEKNAKANRNTVVFCRITKFKRGYYEAHVDLVIKDPSDLPEKELTKMYRDYLEKAIRANPEMWLWSHRRWKHEWRPEYGAVE